MHITSAGLPRPDPQSSTVCSKRENPPPVLTIGEECDILPIGNMRKGHGGAILPRHRQILEVLVGTEEVTAETQNHGNPIRSCLPPLFSILSKWYNPL